jgi:hypothetical protein
MRGLWRYLSWTAGALAPRRRKRRCVVRWRRAVVVHFAVSAVAHTDAGASRLRQTVVGKGEALGSNGHEQENPK